MCLGPFNGSFFLLSKRTLNICVCWKIKGVTFYRVLCMCVCVCVCVCVSVNVCVYECTGRGFPAPREHA